MNRGMHGTAEAPVKRWMGLGLLLLAAFGVMPALQAVEAPTSLLLWNGEGPISGLYGSANTTQAYRGTYCYQAVPDQWHAPVISLAGSPAWRKDISAYDEIWFYVKSDQTGKTFDFSVSGYPNNSNAVNIDPYIQGGHLDATYRLVRIPLAALKTATYTLNSIESFSFGLAKPTPGHKLYIDEIWAVRTSAIDVAHTPLVGSFHDIDFGDVPVGGSIQKSFTVTNVGAAALTVTGVGLSGVNTSEFAMSASPFNLAPGQSQNVLVTFSPANPGDKTGVITLAHNATAMGVTTSVQVKGRGMGPSIEAFPAALDFGSAPVGTSVSWLLTLNNPGNQELRVTSITSSLPAFAASPASITVAAGASQQITVSCTPAAAGSVAANLTLNSNDVNHVAEQVPLRVVGLGPSGGVANLSVRVGAVTSSSAELAWVRFLSADQVRVYVGPEPPDTPNAALPDSLLVQTLAGDKVGTTVEKLAAATDAFIRIEAARGTSLLAAQNLHIRTVGGPRAALDTPVREVHLYGPHVVQVVVANPGVQSYSSGDDFQDHGTDSLGDYLGLVLAPNTTATPQVVRALTITNPTPNVTTWTVARRDGTPLHVTQVYRHSIPMGTPREDQMNVVDVDHEIFLVLDAPVGSREVLHVQGPFGVDFILPYSDYYLETPVIQVNQVGYCPRSTQRWAYVSGWMGDGGGLPLSDFSATADLVQEPVDPLRRPARAVAGLPITVRAANDAESGGEVREINLASVPAAEGVTYRVRIPGVGVSWPTAVSESAVFKSYYITARGLFHNRWGRDLQPQWTDWCARPPDHPIIYTSENPNYTTFHPRNMPLIGERAHAGGHHDAGDFDIRPYHYDVALLLMQAYEANAEAFTDNQLTIPESGNGIPDFLDEALWSIRGWELLQEDDGGVRAGVESYSHPPGYHFADQDTLPYWTYARDAIHTLRCCGLFAQASRLVAPFSPSKAEELRNRAIRAYNYAVAQGQNEAICGPILYAASELFRLTGEAQYADMVQKVWQQNDPYGRGMDFYSYLPWRSSYDQTANQPAIAQFILGYLGRPGANPTYVSQAKTTLTLAADGCVGSVANGHAHRNGRPASWGTLWGLDTAAGGNVLPVLARMELPGVTPEKQQEYLDTLSLSADYVLGCNAAGMAWLTGLGSRRPRQPLHLDSLAFMREGKEPIPGIPVYGPVGAFPRLPYYDYGSNVYYPAFDQHPMLRRYGDNRLFVTVNEFDNSIQALHAQLFAALLGLRQTPPDSLLPRGAGFSGGTATAPRYVNAPPIDVSYSGARADSHGGLRAVHLWVKKDAGPWTDTGLTSTTASGSFRFTGVTEEGVYSFATQAETASGEKTADPNGTGSTSTTYDGTPPNPGTMTVATYTTTPPIEVSYTGVSDALSGLRRVILWVKKGINGSWTNTGLTAATGDGTLDFTDVTGDNKYFFYLQAEDNAGMKTPEPTDSIVFGSAGLQ